MQSKHHKNVIFITQSQQKLKDHQKGCYDPHAAYNEMIIWCAIRNIVHKILHPFFIVSFFCANRNIPPITTVITPIPIRYAACNKNESHPKYSFIMPNTPAANISTTGIPPIPIRIFSNLFTGFSSFKTSVFNGLISFGFSKKYFFRKIS